MLNFGSSLLGFMLIKCALSSKIFHKSPIFLPQNLFPQLPFPWSHSTLYSKAHLNTFCRELVATRRTNANLTAKWEIDVDAQLGLKN